MKLDTLSEVLRINLNGNPRRTIPVDRFSAGTYVFQFYGDTNVKPVIWMKK